ncbi:hypothetical protein DHEL01_v207150 [Diaporthe helianthi]|uniref:Histone chaperone RTT106/FACT complex subunit SPT16-like middle domain-containing protein n=1 Tax=Diaporthe helianthi TaxID=158607 RepID=A0A2P5HW40_DIAHE|nr:hypothetical protein DHEL01_v207150 [Diaporthe helianthi]
MATLDDERLGLVFATRPDILDGIKEAADTPERIALFNSIASFVAEQTQNTAGEPSAKRKRVEGSDGAAGENGSPSQQGMLPRPTQTAATAGTPQTSVVGAGVDSLLIDMANAAAKEVILLEVKEVSVLIPQRKKYDLCFTKNYLYTKQVDTTTPVQGMVYDWSQLEYVLYMPIPEKQQLNYNYILFPRNTALASTKSFPPADLEPLVFSVPAKSPKPGVVGGYAAQTASQVSDSYSSLMHWAISSQLQSVNNTTASIVSTDPRVFASAVRQPHRPKEKAVHVRAHRGSKDGYLFFLPNGILWGFKKPLLFIPLERINAVSYVNVLQRTFNMVVEIDVSHAPQPEQQPKNGAQGAQWDEEEVVERPLTEEIEFSMIDQEDYSTIDDTYVRRHGLDNRSMAEGRKAKRQLRENAKADVAEADGAKNGAKANGEQLPENLTQLALLGDEEDDEEDEEDYDPGSEGESEGEGSSSEEEDDDDEEGDEEADGYDEDGGEEEGYVEDHE